MNPNGVAHGAIAVTLMDMAMRGAVLSALDDEQRCATVEIHTRFHASAHTEDWPPRPRS